MPGYVDTSGVITQNSVDVLEALKKADYDMGNAFLLKPLTVN
jgi:hypothetical protein